MKPLIASCVGVRWRGHDGGIYLCTRYVYKQDFWLRLIEIPEGAEVFRRQVGDDVCVSLRAMSRTFHRTDFFVPMVPHESPCDCEECNPTLPHPRW